MLKKVSFNMPLSDEFLSENERLLWAVITKRISPLSSRKGSVCRKAGQKNTFCSAGNKSRIVFFDSSSRKTVLAKTPSAEMVRVLDLHGFTVQEAFSLFRSFMEQARGMGWREVEIITGLGASGKGIIRRELRHWLERKEYSSRITEIYHPPNNLGAVRVKFSVK